MENKKIYSRFNETYDKMLNITATKEELDLIDLDMYNRVKLLKESKYTELLNFYGLDHDDYYFND